MRRSLLVPLACSLALACTTPASETQAPAATDTPPGEPAAGAQDLAAITARDIDAIDAWVRGFYPAIVDPWNPDFEARWSRAVEQAHARAEQVSDGAGWRMTIEALVGSTRDGHVYLRPSDQAPSSRARGLEWTGHVVELVGDRYVLHALGPAKDLDNAALVSCEGVPIDAFAETTLDLFRGDWTILAQRRRMIPLLLIDTGNPFVSRAQQCVVDIGGEQRTWTLEWTSIESEQLTALLPRYQGVKLDQRERVTLEFTADGAAWITLGNLTDEAGYIALERALADQLTKIRRAPYVVWDVRGNGGGNSALGLPLFARVWGTQPPMPAQTRPKQWRASPEVVELLQRSRVELESQGRSALVAFLDEILPQLERAVQSGAELHAELPPQPDDPAAADPTANEQARVQLRAPSFVLTDGGCFSSCIMSVNTLRSMGAKQIGLPTDRNAVYGESWFSRELPSGFGSLTLPLAIFGEDPELLGGGPPDLPWTGAPTDEDGLRRFIAEAAAQARAQPHTRPSKDR